MSTQRLEVCDVLCTEMFFFRLLNDSLRQRMFTPGLKIQCRLQKLCFAVSFRRKNIRNCRFPLRDRSGLIKGDDLYLAGIFHRFRSLEEDAILRPHSVSDHDRNRCRKSKCTRAGNDKHRNCVAQSRCQRRSDNQPDHKHNGTYANDSRHKHSRNLICNPRNRSLGPRRIRYHLNDLRKGCIFTNPGCSDLEVTGTVDRCRRYLVPGPLVHRQRFTGQNTFINGACPFFHDAVNRNCFPGLDREDIARLHFVDTDDRLLAIL